MATPRRPVVAADTMRLFSLRRLLERFQKDYSSSTWLFVFLPALVYFVTTRIHQTGLSYGGSSSWTLGPLITAEIQLYTESNDLQGQINACQQLQSIFYTKLNSRDACLSLASERLDLRYGLHLVQATGLEGIVSSIWRHDSELGRGFLLLSQSVGNGRIWRWEVGGGPIAIGKSLHMDQAGCRSDYYKDCASDTAVGSGGIAIDSCDKDNDKSDTDHHPAEGKLVIAEWGEGRIVRLEDNGARTPLVVAVPRDQEEHATCRNTETSTEQQLCLSTRDERRVHRPNSLLYTPSGDLFFIDHFESCLHPNETIHECQAIGSASALYQLKHASRVPRLDSLEQSREAHSWTSLGPDTRSLDSDQNGTEDSSTLPRLLFQQVHNDREYHSLGGMALAESLKDLYVSVQMADESKSLLLLKIPLVDESGVDDEVNEVTTKTIDETATYQVVLNLTELVPSWLPKIHTPTSGPGPIALSQSGVLFWATSDGSIMVFDMAERVILGRLQLILPMSGTKGDWPVTISSMTLGDDGFLYVTTSNRLFRIRVHELPIRQTKVSKSGIFS